MANVPTRRRLTEAETSDRMLGAAMSLLRREGLTLDLRLRMEEVIEAAGVSRAAAYRKWPNRDVLVRDVLQHVADSVEPPTVSAAEADRLVQRIARRHKQIPANRLQIAADLLTEAALLEVAHLLDSGEWRDYLLLVAAVDTLPEGDVRDSIAKTLAVAEERRSAGVVAAYDVVTETLGLRLRAGRTQVSLARVATAMIRGSVTDAWRSADRGARSRVTDDVKVAFPALLAAYLEPDPTAEVPADWPRRVRESVREVLA
ncbi:TetR/AcrR family transcriptional regulator [Flexivirga meconopsidis]|uniref:TetR/AcrR family transcriptional regulator n=1 Tax=Flexivirga meconopsidis TaxID=2977121 RepID=UPI0022400CFC|nr:TetR family transcriptional regulator [Flexivirga meconopsidis]